MSFLKFEPTPENIEKVEKYVLGEPDEARAKHLCGFPLSRISVAWITICQRNGLSPFAYAGITRRPPREVVEQYAKEPPHLEWGLCTTVELPVGGAQWEWTQTGYIMPGRSYEQSASAEKRLLDFTYYEADLENYLLDGGYDYGDEQSWDELKEAKGPRSFKRRTMEALLERFGGKTWKRHCVRKFNPFHVTGGGISEKGWKQLKSAYYLRDF